jgi:Fe2+ transport system protein B
LTVIRISAKTGEGINELISTIRENKYLRNSHLKIYAEDVQKEIDHIEGDLNHELEEARNPKFAAVKVFERDPYFHALSNSSTEDEVRAIEANYNMDAEQIIADQRYDFVTAIKSDCCTEKEMPESMTDKLDKVFLNKWAAIPLVYPDHGLRLFPFSRGGRLLDERLHRCLIQWFNQHLDSPMGDSVRLRRPGPLALGGHRLFWRVRLGGRSFAKRRDCGFCLRHQLLASAHRSLLLHGLPRSERLHEPHRLLPR